MRFLLSFVLVIVVFAAVLAAFVLPREQWQSLLTRLPDGWLSANATNETADNQPSAVVNAGSAQSVANAAPQHQAIRIASGIQLGDWLYDCEDDDSASNRPCIIAYQIADKGSGSIVFSWLIGVGADGSFQAVWQTPTGVMVNRGVVLDAGTEEPITLPYTACVAGFCEALANLAPDFVETLLETPKATATVSLVSGQTLAFPISVDGLADGIVALKNRARQR